MKQESKQRCFADIAQVNENHWQPLTASLLKILDNVYSTGSSTGIAASSHRGSTLKGVLVQII